MVYMKGIYATQHFGELHVALSTSSLNPHSNTYGLARLNSEIRLNEGRLFNILPFRLKIQKY